MASFIPAGANAVETSDIRTSGDVTVTDTQPGTVGDGEFLTNSGGLLTGEKVQTPLLATDEAITFTESDLNVTLDRTQVSNGSITLSNGGELETTLSYSGLKNDQGGISSETQSINTAGISEANISMQADDYYYTDELYYRVYINGTKIFDRSRSPKYKGTGGPYSVSGSRTFTSESGNVNVLVEIESNQGHDNGQATIELLTSPQNSGNVKITFEQPIDIDRYDLVGKNTVENGGNVQVDVIDSSENVLKSDISDNTDISNISKSNNVGFNVSLSRQTESDNPRLDYVARRYVR